MKSLNIPMISIFICLVFYSCKNNSDSGIDTISDPKSILTRRTWIIVQISSFTGTHIFDSNEVRHAFTFYKDGSFVEDFLGGCCKNEGEWEMNNDYSILSLTNSRNDRSYNLYGLSMNELELAWQGREGMVIEKYKPKKLISF